jgi:cytochrome c-type biogenesis protein CcmH
MLLLWLLFALMTAAVLRAVLRPLTRAAAPADDVRADIAVYRDQLAEIDGDAARGLIDGQEAESARREVARRLLARADALDAGPLARPVNVRALYSAVALLVPMSALAGYLVLGAPSLPDRPTVARGVPLEQAPVDALIAKVEARLRANPDDGQGWEVIAPVYFRLERFDEAAQAYAQAARLLGETTERLAGFAEATVLSANGIVTEPARLAYEKIRAMEPGRVEPRFWLALAKEQDGKMAEAAAEYRAILAAAPAEAAWRPLVEERLAAVDPSVPKVARPARGPSADDMKAAGEMSDKDRGQMIAAMVDGLAQRLKTSPQDAPGWVRLVQSYVVLGERAKALEALGEARRHLAGNPAALAELAALAKTLGLGS